MIFRPVFASFLVGAAAACSSSSPSAGTADAAAKVPHEEAGVRVTDAGLRATDGRAPATDGRAPVRDGSVHVDAARSEDGRAADAGPDLDMQPSDFDCILGWAKVGDFRITNKLVEAGASIAVAADLDGGVYPVGTVIQLIPNEAMAKRRAGFNATTRDWEFFNLSTSASGTVINQRGGAEVTNASGSCDGCHGQAEAQFDLVCGTTHGCAPLPFNEAEIQLVQNGDPRCH